MLVVVHPTENVPEITLALMTYERSAKVFPKPVIVCPFAIFVNRVLDLLGNQFAFVWVKQTVQNGLASLEKRKARG